MGLILWEPETFHFWSPIWTMWGGSDEITCFSNSVFWRIGARTELRTRLVQQQWSQTGRYKIQDSKVYVDSMDPRGYNYRIQEVRTTSPKGQRNGVRTMETTSWQKRRRCTVSRIVRSLDSQSEERRESVEATNVSTARKCRS